MENKADIKAIMARFQAGAVDESGPPSPLRPKAPLNLTLSSGPAPLPKKPVLESLSGGGMPPKPSYLKNLAPGPNKTKVLASRFDQDETGKVPDRGLWKNPEDSSLTPKPALKPTISIPKPTFPKPPPAASKPSGVSSPSPSPAPAPAPAPAPDPDPTMPPRMPSLHQKPGSSLVRLWQQSEANADHAPQGVLKDSQVVSPPRPPASKKPSLKKPASQYSHNLDANHLIDGGANGDTTSEPKRNPLPNSLTLGPAPAKPARPPKVDLEDFRRSAGSDTFDRSLPPTTLAPGNHSNHAAQPPQSALPSLPPRPFGSTMQQEESYDDIEDVRKKSPPPPPLPPSTAHPSQRAKEEEDEGSSDDMYEPLDEPCRDEEEKKKEERRQLEAEKKEQKSREKKEQEARKKFKMVGPLEAVHQGRVCVDCRGSKTELALKRGDALDIIRVQGNPEGKWLGRKQDGSIGYVKTTSVEIDFNSLKSHQAQRASKFDVYDDVDVASSDSSGGVVLPPPPPPPDEDWEIYNDVIDPDLDVSPLQSRFAVSKPHGLLKLFDRNRRPASAKVLPPPSQFTAEDNSGAMDEIYCDVDAQNQPPPPPISSIPGLKGKGKADQSNTKMLKKFEKEEKEFRKKFKYEGEIQVLHQASITTSSSSAPLNKKWGGKDLAVRVGEKVDVVAAARTGDNKVICRNQEGKFGYVSSCHISMDDGDIYDDVGDDCIYDNE